MQALKTLEDFSTMPKSHIVNIQDKYRLANGVKAPSYKYAYLVSSEPSYNIARRSLGPLAAIGCPVWVHTGFSSDHKQHKTQADFRRWIKPFTAHNDKMGLNASALEKLFVPDPDNVSVPERSTYPMFANIYTKLKGEGDPYPNFKKNLKVQQIVS